MSLLNRMAVTEPENVLKNLSAKQFGLSNNQSVIKKKALLDVKNTLHQKSVLSIGKCEHIKKRITKGKKELVGEENKKTVSNYDKEDGGKVNSVLSVTVEDNEEFEKENVEPVCCCWENCEDEYADFILKDIKVTKNQIENIALNWENPPVFNVNDKREIGQDLKPMKVQESDYLDLDFTWQTTLLPELDMEMPEVPFVHFELEDNGYNSCVGL